MNKKVILVSLLLSGASIFATSLYAINEVSTIELLGDKYYVYEVKKGDTLFGIARSLGWNDETLQKLNPTAVAPLKKGMKIYYPYSSDSIPSADIKVVENYNEVGDADSVKPLNRQLIHTVKRGETVNGIALVYNIPADQIFSLNPGSREGIKVGQQLVLAIKNDQPANSNLDSKAPQYVTIKLDDTLESIAKSHNVSVAAILKENPGFSIANFREGTTLRLPQEGEGISYLKKNVASDSLDDFALYVVDKDDTWEGIAQKYGITTSELKSANPQIQSLSKNLYIAIPRMKKIYSEKEVAVRDSRETNMAGLEQIYNDVHKIYSTSEISPVKIAVVLENDRSKKDIEYLRGFLAGIDHLKDKYKINLKVVSSSESNEKTITDLGEFKPGVVFTTSEKNLPSYLCEYALVSQTPLVNTFDVKSYEFANNPYIVQLLTPSNLFNENVSAYLEDKFGDHTILFMGEEDPSDMLAQSLKRIISPGKYRDISLDELELSRINPEGKYIFYSYDVKKEGVEALLDKVAEIREALPYADIYTLGRPNLISYEESLAEKYHKANLLLPSRFYIDTDSEQNVEFNRIYKSLFKKAPQKSMPLYAAVGYDNATYFISQLAEHHNDINSFTPSLSNVQSFYDFQRISNWSGLTNPPVFMLRYTPFNTTEINVVNYRD